MDKQHRKITRRKFLLSFFDGEGYEEKNVNGFWLVKSKSPDGWFVSIYTEDSFKKYKQYGVQDTLL